METEADKYDDLDFFKKRIEILTGAQLREVDRVNTAITIQDNIRKKINNWNGVKEIRKWREAR